jgi:hypothetical protein
MPKRKQPDDVLPEGGAAEGVDDNLPGFGYAQRVITAWTNALTAMGETFNQSWSDIQQGRYDFGSFMKASTSVWGTSFDVLAEVWKGPNLRTGPQWLHFQFQKKPAPSGSPDVLTGTARLDRKWGRDVNLQTVEFERLGQPVPAATASDANAKGKAGAKTGAQPDGVSAGRVWTSCTWSDDLRRDAVDVTLNVATVRELPPGQYLGFVLASGTTAEPPLVIVMLQVVE